VYAVHPYLFPRQARAVPVRRSRWTRPKAEWQKRASPKEKVAAKKKASATAKAKATKQKKAAEVEAAAKEVAEKGEEALAEKDALKLELGTSKKERRQKKQKKERRERAKKSKRRTEKAPKRRGKGTLSVIDVARQFEAHDELLSSWRNIIMIVAHRYNYNRYLAFATSVSIAASTAGEWRHGAVRAKVAERGIWTVQLLRLLKDQRFFQFELCEHPSQT